MKTNNTNTRISKSPKSKKRSSWMAIWLLAFLFALPSCFEISCIKLTGCELLADESGDPLGGGTTGTTNRHEVEQPGHTLEDIANDFVLF